MFTLEGEGRVRLAGGMFDNAAEARGRPIEYFNRHTGRVEVEQVYGEEAMRWLYETNSGKAAAWVVAKRAWFGRWYGWWMRQPMSREKIAPFVQKFGLDVTEFAETLEKFASFDDFFSRKLRTGARPLEGGAETVVFGADGRHLGFPDVSKVDGVFVKGQKWNVEALVGDAELGKKFAQGTLVLSRLCPVDYHRFHFPAEGTPGAPKVINGPLWSVNPMALRKNLAWLWENKRVVTKLETKRLGTVLLMEVGATNVGSIIQTFVPGQLAQRGAEKGYFAFGGSATVTLFEPGRVRLADDLIKNSLNGMELYARMGSRLGVVADGT